jgi:hypothetical protein
LKIQGACFPNLSSGFLIVETKVKEALIGGAAPPERAVKTFFVLIGLLKRFMALFHR